MLNVVNLSAKKFKVEEIKRVDDKFIFILSYGKQVGSISIDANHTYRPQDLYQFVEVLDSLVSQVSIDMFKMEMAAEENAQRLFPGKDGMA